MKRNLMMLMGAALAAVAVSGALAAPIPVKTAGTKGQTSFMCPDCKSKVACAQAGDFRIGLVVDIDNPKLGTGRLTAHVHDKAKKPVNDAKVTVTLSMTAHKHTKKPITLRSRGKGEYGTQVQGLQMTGVWNAVVEVNADGDRVHQTFAFSR